MLFHWKEHFSLSIFWAWQCTHFQHYQQAGPLQPLHWVIWYNHLHSNRGCVLYLISSRHWLNHWPKDLYLTLISLKHLSMLILSLTNEVLHFITTKHLYWKKKILKKKRSKLKTSQPNKRDVFKHPQSNIFVLENNRTSSNSGVFVQSLMNNQITDQYRPQCALLISMLGAGISEMISNTSPHIPWTEPTDRAVCAANSESFITRSWCHNSMIQCL